MTQSERHAQPRARNVCAPSNVAIVDTDGGFVQVLVHARCGPARSSLLRLRHDWVVPVRELQTTPGIGPSTVRIGHG